MDQDFEASMEVKKYYTEFEYSSLFRGSFIRFHGFLSQKRYYMPAFRYSERFSKVAFLDTFWLFMSGPKLTVIKIISCTSLEFSTESKLVAVKL